MMHLYYDGALETSAPPECTLLTNKQKFSNEKD